MPQTKLVNTTLGGLIVAITDGATHCTHNMRESYALTASILTDILNRREQRESTAAKSPQNDP